MLFNSAIFGIFIFIFFLLWFYVKKSSLNLRWFFLSILSFIFYGWWDWRFLPLLLLSGLIDYFAALAIVRWQKWRTSFLVFSMAGNLGTLFLFKYSHFFLATIDTLCLQLNIPAHFANQVPSFFAVLPVGISFYTFQSMSYTIDVYRGALTPTRNVWHFFSFIALFPQLVAGPIVRASDLLPQLLHVKKVEPEEKCEAVRLLLFGYFKKVVIADGLAHFIQVAFAAPTVDPSGLYWWVVITAFAFQIYCDFSGYTDIARGLAIFMGFHFNINFNHPYLALSMRDFWRRWHISLSTWFRDYLYIPLGGAKKGPFRSHLNMWITMVVSGFWHGASWTFIIWGALHAFYTSLERIFNIKEESLMRSFPLRTLMRFFVIIQVWIAWVFFRANDVEQACQIIVSMLNPATFFQSPQLAIAPNIYFLLLIMIVRHVYVSWKPVLEKRVPILNFAWNFQSKFSPLSIGAMIALIILFRGPGGSFIYFQF